uniref:Exonuclease domain-containing protein n=1 Tax=viral metagenome TaxID=1070528 RepID=A0A6C0B046_9ZZZZ
MLVLVFDTETDGLPQNMRAIPNINNYQDWPKIVQLSYMLYDTDANKIVLCHNYVIRVSNISHESTKIHGITNEKSQRDGIPIKEALKLFIENMKKADLIVAHNVEFDQKVILAELYSAMVQEKESESEFTNTESNYWVNSIGHMLYTKKYYCTMQESIDLCSLESFTKVDKKPYKKFPSLLELYRHLFGYEPQGLHNAIIDVVVCFQCFYKMRFGVVVREINPEIDGLLEALELLK